MSRPPAALVLDALHQEVVLLDNQGTIQFHNEAWSEFGKANDLPQDRTWIGTNYVDYCKGPDGGDAARVGIEEVLAGRRTMFQLEYPCHGPTVKRWFEMTVTRLAQPNQTWIVIVHENVTIRRQAEELRRLAWKQSAAIAAKRQMTVAMRGFVNEVAHEVNTPLTALKLHLHPVLRGIPPETSGAVRHAMERLERSAQRIGAIGWAISKHPRLSVVDSTTLENPLEGVRPEAERRSIRLESDLASGLLLADPVLLGECLACLATACISNCPSGGFVRYEADAEAQRFVLTLRGATGAESSEADLWILAARQLAKISGFQLREERTSPSEQSYTVEVPLAQPRPRNEGVAGFTAEAR